MTSTTSAPGSPQEAIEVRTENLFQRTEVLAGTTPPQPPHPQRAHHGARSSSLPPEEHRLIYICTHAHSLPPSLPLPHPPPKIIIFFNKLLFIPSVGPCRVHSIVCVCLFVRSRLCARGAL